jgi:hypothetical protein
MDSKFALEANNCVIDKFGRIGARKGWTTTHANNATLGSSYIESIGECVGTDGTHTLICAGANKLFIKSGTTLTELTYGGGASTPVITSNNWQTATLNGVLLLFQEGYDTLLYDPSTSTTQYRRVSEHATYSGTLGKNHCGIAAYGRIWSARSTTDKITLQWSDTLTFQKWTAGTAGSLNLYGVWPQGGDEIIGIAAHNNQLLIFGLRQILIYTGAKDPSTMTLYDTIGNCGAIGRDTIQTTPDDIVFLSAGGVRSLARTIQEKSAPISTISRTVNNDIQDYIRNENSSTTIKSVYSPIDSFYLLTFITSSTTYCFDMRVPFADGSYRVTTWTGLLPRCYFYSTDRNLYLGLSGNVGLYSTYLDNASSYRMSWYGAWLDFGDPVKTSILKKISMTIVGVQNQTIIYKWGFDYMSSTRFVTTVIPVGSSISEYNISEYGISEFSSNIVVRSVGMNIGGAGKVIQMGMECQVSGNPISIQRVDIFTKDGAYK